MVLTMEPESARQHLLFSGIHHSSATTSEDDIFRAYVEFACHRTDNDAAMYENAASLAPLYEQKHLFLQLAGRKRETLQKVRMTRSAGPFTLSSLKKAQGHSLAQYILDLETTPLLTAEDACNLATRRENKTLLLYEKLLSTATHASIRGLFEMLVASQREHIGYIATQLASVCCNAVNEAAPV